MNARIASLSTRIAAVDAVVAEHPHAQLLVLAQHALFGLRQRLRPRVAPCDLGDTGYRANPEHFARQMDVFARMREVELGFRRTSGGPP